MYIYICINIGRFYAHANMLRHWSKHTNVTIMMPVEVLPNYGLKSSDPTGVLLYHYNKTNLRAYFLLYTIDWMCFWYFIDLEKYINLIVVFPVLAENIHYSDVIMNAMASPLFAHLLVQVQIKHNIEAPLHWPLWVAFTGDRWIPPTKGQ